jgi:subtilase family serine protease
VITLPWSLRSLRADVWSDVCLTGIPCHPPKPAVVSAWRVLLILLMMAVIWNRAYAQQTPQTLHNHVRREVSSGQASLVGSLPPEQQLNLTIVLPLRNQADLANLLGRLYDPASPDYRKFLSVDQFTEQFGPTVEDYKAVVSFAHANGFVVGAAPANRLVVSISGSVDQISKAFHLTMNVYRHPTEDRTFFSPDREPSLDLEVPVTHIAGLNNFSIPHPMLARNQNGPLAATVQGSGPGGSYLGSDMRAAYYGGATLDGNGQSVGILEFGGYSIEDVNETFTNAGQSYSVPVNNVLLDGATPEPGGDDAEQVLDIVQAIGMAPGLSQVRVYIGAGLDDANILNSMASENIAKQLSCSWGWRPDDPGTDDVFFQEFAAQGQTFFAASGDSGAFDAAVSPFFYPAEDVYVTTVGGTHLTTNGPAGTWASEVTWNSLGAGSGGGVSPDGIPIASWQAGLASSSNGASTTERNAPDVAMEGDFDNYACSINDCEEDYAGTSFAAPRWAGFMALVNQQAVEAGTAPHGGIGFLNPILYSIGQSSSYSKDFHDITTGNNDTANQPVWFSAVTGYDLTTGWGSANGQDLIDDLAGKQVPGFWIAAATPTLSLNQGASTSTTISVSDADGFSGSVTLALASALPSGVTASWSTNPTTGSSVLTLRASATAPPGTATLTITGTSGKLTATTNVTIAVHTPTFLLSSSSTALQVSLSGSTTSTITVTPEYGFTGSVNLAVSGLPGGVTASFSPNPATGATILTVMASSSALGGTSTLTITGTSGKLTETTTLSLSVLAPTFTLSTYGALNIGQGASSGMDVWVEPLNGFTGNVSLAISGLPGGVTAAFSSNPTNGLSQVTLTASSSATLGTKTVTITGTSGKLTQVTTFSLGVFAPAFTISNPGSMSIGQGTSSTAT